MKTLLPGPIVRFDQATAPETGFRPCPIKSGRIKKLRLIFLLLAGLAGCPWPAAAQWLPLTSGTPSPRGYSSMAEDSVRAKIVLFGGTADGSFGLDDTWEWSLPNGPWQRVAVTGSKPGARFVHGMAQWLSGSTSHVLVFGGAGNAGGLLGDSWTWDGTTWRAASATGPSARALLAMACDPIQHRVLLFGGFDGSSLLGDTWSWDGTNWAQLPVSGPSPRAGHAMAYDSQGGKIWLFGGQDASGYRNDTWAWDGAAWSLASTNGPVARRDHALARRGHGLVLYGGIDSSDTALSDTWEWDGAVWTQTISGCPGARYSLAMASDSATGTALLYGGSDAAFYADTWRYLGPIILSGPSNVVANPGQPVSFTIQVSSAGGAPAYQWERNCNASFQPIAGATNATYSIPSVTAGDACLYRCVAALQGCTATSQVAQLDVPLDIDIRLNQTIPHDQAQQTLVGLGAVIQDSSPYFNRISCQILSSRLAQVAALPWVVATQAQPKPVTQNDGSRLSIGVPSVQGAPWGVPNAHNLTGSQVKTGIWDQGQPGVPVTVGVVNVPAHADIAGRWIPEESAPPFNAAHVTHVAGTMAGDGFQSASQGGTFLQWAGMAPRAEIHTWDFAGFPFTEMLNGVLANKLNLSQNSWGFADPASIGAYLLQCGDADRLVWDKKLPIFFAAGNYQIGYTLNPPFFTAASPGTAKNVVAVGAVAKITDVVSAFSSFGPTKDGRLKPDVVAVGVDVESCANSGNGYTLLSGTSMACPAVSGLAALLIEKYRQFNAGAFPDPALLKAILCNCATDLGNPGPDFRYGYGKVNAVESARNLQDGDHLYVAPGLSSGGVHTYPLIVAPDCPRLKVMLVWSDREFPGTSVGVPTLINDLDLVLVDPSNGQHLPLTLNPAVPNAVAVPLANHRDNVEQVVINAPAAGLWQIQVRGFNVPQGPQPYALDWCLPACVPPPAGMVLWLPFDELIGNTAYNSRGGNDGTLYDGVSVATAGTGPFHDYSGYVAKSLHFDGLNDSVQVPNYPGINLGASDFTIDAWIKPATLSGQNPRVIVDHHEEPLGAYRGYSLFLGGNFNNLYLFLADGAGYSTYLTGVNVPVDSNWHHVAVTVARADPAGIRCYLDGVWDNIALNPTTHAGSLTPGPAVPFRVGAGAQSLDPSFFNGGIDEVEVFRRALGPEEIRALWQAGSKGKCKVSCHLDWDTAVCTNSGAPTQSVAVQGKIKNDGPLPVTANYSFSGLPPIGECTLPGPTIFAPASGTVTVAAGTTVYVSTTVQVPLPGPNQESCYQMTVDVPATGDRFHCQGSFEGLADLCVMAVPGGGVITTLLNATNVARWHIVNRGSAPILLPWRVMVYDPEMRMAANIGFPDKTSGTLPIAPGGSVELAVPFWFQNCDPGRFYDLVLMSGTQVLSSETLLQTQSQRPIVLTAILSGTNIALSWPESAPGVSLEETANFLGSDTIWTTVTNAPVNTGGVNVISLPTQHPKGFYRLKQTP